ncbi:CBM96 family carbohydrate-binding protein, partial [Pyxidicoccus fallax]
MWSGKRGVRAGWSAFAVVGLLTGCGVESPATDAAEGPEQPAQAQRLEGSTYTINVYSDATVDAQSPDQNFGSTTRLTVDGEPERRAYLRFAVGTFEGRIKRATLRLYATDPSVDGPAVHATSNNWNFSTLTWNNAPAVGAKVADVGAVADDAFVEYDVTAHVRGSGTFSFVLVSSVADGVVFLSDNGAPDAQDPQLVIETEPCPAPDVYLTPPRFDTYVSEETPDQSYEHPTKLVVDGAPRREAFLSFDVPDTIAIRSARLRLFAKDGSTDGPMLYRTTPLWAGGYFNWYSRPSPVGTPLVDLGHVPNGTWTELDVSSVVTGAGEHAFALLTHSGNGVDFVGYEPGQKYFPRLIVGTGQADTCAYSGDGIGGTAESVTHFGGRGDEEPRALAAAGNGEYVVAGRFSAEGSSNPADYGTGPLPNGRGMALARYRDDGTVAWTRGILTAEQAVPESVAVSPDGGLLVAGTYMGTVDFGTGALPVAELGQNIFIAKFSAAGQPVWSRGFVVSQEGAAGTVFSVELAADAQGGLVLTGSFNGVVNFGGGTLSSGSYTPRPVPQQMGLFLARFASDGAHAWSKAIAHGDYAPTEGTAIALAADGSVLVGGRVGEGSDLGDGWIAEDGLFVARFSGTNGALQWKRMLSGARGTL